MTFCRLCDPYITTTILEDIFGELAHEVASKYLIEYEKGRYRLREQYYRCCSFFTFKSLLYTVV